MLPESSAPSVISLPARSHILRYSKPLRDDHCFAVIINSSQLLLNSSTDLFIASWISAQLDHASSLSEYATRIGLVTTRVCRTIDQTLEEWAQRWDRGTNDAGVDLNLGPEQDL